MTIALALVVVLFTDALSALSVLFGGGICTVGNSIFAWLYFRHPRGVSAQKLVKEAYKGEISKIILMIVLFSAALIWSQYINFIWLLLAYVVVQVTYLFAPLFIRD